MAVAFKVHIGVMPLLLGQRGDAVDKVHAGPEVSHLPVLADPLPLVGEPPSGQNAKLLSGLIHGEPVDAPLAWPALLGRELFRVSTDQLVYQEDDLRVVADRRSAPYLDGLEIDYSDDLVRSGFRLKNPSAAKSCGCGASFAVLSPLGSAQRS